MAGRMASHVEVDDTPPVMIYHEEAVQEAEGNSRHREEIHGCDGFAMIA